MPTVVDIRQADDPRDVIHRAVHVLAEGKLVALPTETVYVLAAHALQPEAVRRMQDLLAAGETPLPLALKSGQEALDYVPRMSRLGRKLARRCWPGPVTIAFDADGSEGLLPALPEGTRQAVAAGGRVHVRVPAHEVVQAILQLSPAPIVTSVERLPEEPDPVLVGDLLARLGGEVEFAIDDGASRYGQPSTLIHVSDAQWRVIEPGVVGENTIHRLSSEIYLFVCTGNTCRSPMAEGLFRKLLSERLQCAEEELADRGFLVASAGLSAIMGAPASPEAIELLARRGIDLRGHESQPLTDRLLDQCDHVFAMTRSHRDSILAARPDAADRVELVSRDGTDVVDPMGGGLRDYEHCQQQIEDHLRRIVEQLPLG